MPENEPQTPTPPLEFPERTARAYAIRKASVHVIGDAVKSLEMQNYEKSVALFMATAGLLEQLEESAAKHKDYAMAVQFRAAGDYLNQLVADTLDEAVATNAPGVPFDVEETARFLAGGTTEESAAVTN